MCVFAKKLDQCNYSGKPQPMQKGSANIKTVLIDTIIPFGWITITLLL